MQYVANEQLTNCAARAETNRHEHETKVVVFGVNSDAATQHGTARYSSRGVPPSERVKCIRSCTSLPFRLTGHERQTL